MIVSPHLHGRITSAAALLVPGLALWLPSGYAWGSALLVLGALLTLPRLLTEPLRPPPARWLVAAIAVMALVWLFGSDWTKGIAVFNRPVRYLGACLCLLYALRYPPQPRFLLAGIALGAACGGLRALYDVVVLGLERPWTSPMHSANAIQLGNWCGLLGLMCWLQLLVFWTRWRWPLRIAVAVACALGLIGSLLSLTRGGWLALALCGGLMVVLVGQRHSWARALQALLLLMVIAVPLGWQLRDPLTQRLDWAWSEAQRYSQQGGASSASTSVGQRLDHGKLAWHMGLDRPITGWGDAGYVAEKERRVASGQASPATLEYGHAHNEVLDQFAKRGLIGVGGLLFLYGVPMALFWPRRRVRAADEPAADTALALRLIGLSVPAAYVGFGFTQVFFAHYNGIVMYLAMIILTYACLAGVEAESSPARES